MFRIDGNRHKFTEISVTGKSMVITDDNMTSLFYLSINHHTVFSVLVSDNPSGKHVRVMYTPLNPTFI